jgi:hypothetical protein
MYRQWRALVKRTREKTDSYSKGDIEILVHEADSPASHHTLA